jgi:hypothetical protein
LLPGFSSAKIHLRVSFVAPAARLVAAQTDPTHSNICPKSLTPGNPSLRPLRLLWGSRVQARPRMTFSALPPVCSHCDWNR